jgi:atlastin
MDTYLFNVIKDRGMSDLQTTREQIVRCFDSVDCFLLPHPGLQVTKKNYSGAINKIEGSFKGLLNRYVRLVFDENIEPKFINNRALTGKELQQFFITYCRMFQDTDAEGKGSFPKAMTMLEATSEANNRNAQDLAIDMYTSRMDKVAGPSCSFIKEHLLMEHHNKIVTDAYTQFDDVATMGSESAIVSARAKLVEEIESLKKTYCETNALRNPFKDLEIYILPAVFAVLSWLIAQIIDTTCDHFVCEATELAFRRMYGIIFFVIVILAWK